MLETACLQKKTKQKTNIFLIDKKNQIKKHTIYINKHSKHNKKIKNKHRTNKQTNTRSIKPPSVFSSPRSAGPHDKGWGGGAELRQGG